MSTEQTKIDIVGIKKEAKNFVAKEFELEEYPLIKKIELENAVFCVFEYTAVTDKEGKPYYNFKAINSKEEIFCFNGSNILMEQIRGCIPCNVKLIKKARDDALKPYYWIFANPE